MLSCLVSQPHFLFRAACQWIHSRGFISMPLLAERIQSRYFPQDQRRFYRCGHGFGGYSERDGTGLWFNKEPAASHPLAICFPEPVDHASLPARASQGERAWLRRRLVISLVYPAYW